MSRKLHRGDTERPRENGLEVAFLERARMDQDLADAAPGGLLLVDRASQLLFRNEAAGGQGLPQPGRPRDAVLDEALR
jgi:hypothetical protein